ncbi:DUF1330 domain-containing protein [Nocardia cyriacigeorgica]
MGQGRPPSQTLRARCLQRTGRWGSFGRRRPGAHRRRKRVVAHEARIAERVVLIEFDSRERAVTAYQSAAYRRRPPDFPTASSATSASFKASTDDRACAGGEPEADCRIPR